MFKRKSDKKKKKGIRDHRKEMFFDKFIKGNLEKKLKVKTEEKELKSKRAHPLDALLKRKHNSAIKKRKQLEMELLLTKKHNSGQLKRKLTTSFGNQLVFIKKKTLKREKKVNPQPRQDMLIDLKNAANEIIDDLSDCEFIGKKEYQMKSPNPRKSLKKDYDKDTNKQSTTDRIVATKST